MVFCQVLTGRQLQILLFYYYKITRIGGEPGITQVKKQSNKHPSVYAFLPNKSRATYVRLFHIIQEKAQNLQLQFKPDTVVIDFQGAIKQVIQLNFPTSTY